MEKRLKQLLDDLQFDGGLAFVARDTGDDLYYVYLPPIGGLRSPMPVESRLLMELFEDRHIVCRDLDHRQNDQYLHRIGGGYYGQHTRGYVAVNPGPRKYIDSQSQESGE